MKIDKLILNPLDNNTYFIINNNEVIVVDPAEDTIKIQEYLDKNNLKVCAIFITHYHYDHIGSLEYLKEKYKVKVYDYTTIGSFKEIGLKFKVIPTKGHSMDSVSFYFEKTKDLFVGDFVFYESIGRMDLEGGSEEEMYYSLNELKKIDKDTKLYPGHGISTTLEHELLYNPYI